MPHLVDNFGEDDRPHEDQQRSDPVVDGEGIAEVNDREQQRNELPKRNYQRYGQGGALCRQDIHGTDAEVLREDISKEVHPHDRDADVQDRNVVQLAGVGYFEVIPNVGRQEQEEGQRKEMRVEQSFLRVFAVALVEDFLVDSHPGGHEEGKRQKRYSHSPPEEHGHRVFFLGVFHRLGALDILAGDDRTDDDPGAYHSNGQILGEGIPLPQDNDSHDHVGDQRSRPEDHVQRHRDVEIEGIVVAHAGDEEHGHQDEVVLETDPRLDGAAFGRVDEPFQGDEEELQERDEVARTRIDPGRMEEDLWN